MYLRKKIKTAYQKQFQKRGVPNLTPYNNWTKKQTKWYESMLLFDDQILQPLPIKNKETNFSSSSSKIIDEIKVSL